MGFRRGQAAVEYLTTYGWAILVLVIVFAALVGSGMLSPNFLVTDECSFGTYVKCTAALYNQNDFPTVGMNIFNGFPYEIMVTDITIQTQDGTKSVSGFGSGFQLKSGESKNLTGRLGGAALPTDAVKRFVGNITYVSCAPELGGCTENEHVLSGHITAKVIRG
jgi:hypothetical protein